MKIWGLGDFHLYGSGEDPMLKYGAAWAGHKERIAENIRAAVAEDDLLLVPGDLTLVTKPEQALEDLAFLGGLPGTIVLGKGNHDFWWGAIGKVRKSLPSRVHAIQNDSFTVGGVSVCGTRGWFDGALRFDGFFADLTVKGGADEPESRKAKWDAERDNEAIYAREVARLKLSLETLPDRDTLRVAMLHYPPTNREGADTPMTELLESFGIRHCVFGHLHGPFKENSGNPFCQKADVTYHLVSADYVGFAPALVAQLC